MQTGIDPNKLRALLGDFLAEANLPEDEIETYYHIWSGINEEFLEWLALTNKSTQLSSIAALDMSTTKGRRDYERILQRDPS